MGAIKRKFNAGHEANGTQKSTEKKTKQDTTTSNAQVQTDRSLFNLQAEQLVKQLRTKIQVNAESLITSITRQIKEIKDVKCEKLSDLRQRSKKAKIAIPFLRDPSEDLQLNFGFSQPEIHICDSRVILEMPEDLVQPKDYLNYRVHHKVAAYLFYVARSLKNKYELHWRKHQSYGAEQVSLLITYKSCTVTVDVGVPRSTIDATKLESDKNADRSVEGATPMYNASVLLLTRLNELAKTVDTPQFEDAVLLAGRMIDYHQLPLTPEQFAVLAAALLQGGGRNGGKMLSPNASALQLVRGVLQSLANIKMSFGKTINEPGCWIDEYNLFSNFAEQDYHCMSTLAPKLNDLLSDAQIDPVKSFSKAFLERHVFTGAHDIEVQIDQHVDIQRMWRTLRRALGDRASLIRVLEDRSSTVQADDPFAESSECRIQVTINYQEAASNLILGPPANSAESKSFHSFWQQHAELRKFKDGRILETVALDSINPTIDAIEKIIALHFDVSFAITGSISSEVRQLALKQRKLCAEFDEFVRLARQIDDLPLSIATITSSDSMFATSAGSLPNKIDVVLTFEGSARWPDDVAAIQRTKLAFMSSLKAPLSAIPGVVDVSLALENQLQQPDLREIMNIGVLEVSVDSGVTYCVRVHADREVALLKSFIASPEVMRQSHVKARYQGVLDLYHDTYSETHSQFMRNIASLQPAFSETAIMLKAWFNKHYMSSLFNDKVIDMIAYHVTRDTSSAHAGYFRAIRFLANWDWRAEPLNLSTDPTTYAANESAFTSNVSICIYPPYQSKCTTIDRIPALRMTVTARRCMKDQQMNESAASTRDFDFLITLATTQQRYKNIKSEDASLRRLFLEELNLLYGSFTYFFHSATGPIGVKFDPSVFGPRKFRPNLNFNTLASDTESVEFAVDTVIAEIQRLGGSLIASIRSYR